MISIIIPAFNEEAYIESTINSIKIQDFKDYEIIVICDGCTDKTYEKVKNVVDKVIVLPKKQGPAIARNKGAKIAKGEVLVFLDADTKITNKVLEDFYKNKDNYIAGTAKIKPSSNKIKHKIFMTMKNYIICPFGVTNGILFCKKELFVRTMGFPEIKKREEGIFVRQLIKNGKFYISKQSVINSTRRFDKKGYIKVLIYWIKESIKPSNEEYEAIR